jgi:hypothetical protein
MGVDVVYDYRLQYFKCCENCKNRHPCCSDKCLDYFMAKSIKRAAEQLERERFIEHRRWANGRKQR